MILTHRDLPRATESVSFYEGDPRELIEQSVVAEYDRIWLVGGAAVARVFLDEGLVDEIRLSVIPVLLGSGISLFGHSSVERAMHLTGTTAYENSIVALRYEIEHE